MKVIILAGGYGTRLAEYTDKLPKPMVSIGGRPIIWHIMQSFAAAGLKDFIIALGYKGEVIKDYFLNYRALNSNFSLDMLNGTVTELESDSVDWNVALIDTGLDTMTGGRLKRLREYISDDPVMVTYGDGVANIDINSLLAFHAEHGKMVTVTAVRPTARFGELNISGNQVIEFKEKPQLEQGWINGGFFVIEPQFFDLIENDNTMLEREPLEKAAKLGELMAFFHDGFWQSMDTKRDRDMLEKHFIEGAPWIAKR